MDEERFAMTKPGCVPKLINCFSDHNELVQFVGQLYSASSEVIQYCDTAAVAESREVLSSKLIMALVTHVLFVRQNYDVIQQLLSKLEVDFVSVSDINNMRDKLNSNQVISD